MNVRISPVAKKTTQSGRAGLGRWLLAAELPTARVPEPLMGWVSAGDTLKELRMEFDTQDQAISFAKSNGWAYTLVQPSKRRVKPRNYGDNFVYRPVDDKK